MLRHWGGHETSMAAQESWWGQSRLHSVEINGRWFKEARGKQVIPGLEVIMRPSLFHWDRKSQWRFWGVTWWGLNESRVTVDTIGCVWETRISFRLPALSFASMCIILKELLYPCTCLHNPQMKSVWFLVSKTRLQNILFACRIPPIHSRLLLDFSISYSVGVTLDINENTWSRNAEENIN